MQWPSRRHHRGTITIVAGGRIRYIKHLCVAWLSIGMAPAETVEDQKMALQRLEQQATKFAQEAHHFRGSEQLVQTVQLTDRKGQPRSQSREIVSEYTLVQTAPGSLVELRRVVSVDKKPVKAGEGLDSLAASLLAADDKGKQKLLESFEKHGLKGAARDIAQVILLFQPGRIERYEFNFAGNRLAGELPVKVYSFQQLDGPETMTVYVDGQPVRQRLRGEVWFRAYDYQVIQIALLSEHIARDRRVKMISAAVYGLTGLPEQVRHTELVDGKPYIDNMYRYSDFRRLK